MRDASDLAQDVFVRAYRGLHRFKEQSSLATWLYRIGVNVSLNKVSARKLVTAPIAEQRLVSSAESPADIVLRAVKANFFHALSNLRKLLGTG